MKVPGIQLTDPGWLAAQLTVFRAAWQLDEPRAAVTIWWYMAAAALLEYPVRAGTDWPGAAVLAQAECVVRQDGSVERVEYARPGDGGSLALAAGLRAALHDIIAPLTGLGQPNAQALWAIAADAIGGHALAAGHPGSAGDLAAGIGPPLPAPRFEPVAGRIFVRRGSCCLIYLAPGADKCMSCPKHPPAQRRALLAKLVRGGSSAWASESSGNQPR